MSYVDKIDTIDDLFSNFLNLRRLDNEILVDTNSTNTDLELNQTYHTERIYLLILDLLIFIVISYYSYQSYRKFSKNKPPPNQSPQEFIKFEFKLNFVKGLLLANGGIF